MPFEIALLVFQDSAAVEIGDARKDYGEARFNIIGRVAGDVLLHVTYTERGERIRIISARHAVKHEIKNYFGQKH